LILVSYHHKNTEQVAKVIAEVLNAKILSPEDVRSDEIRDFNLIGFGSGTYDGKNHQSLLDLASRMPPSSGQSVFIFSTNGAPVSVYGRARYDRQPEYLQLVAKNHLPLRELLQSKGYRVIDEFSCGGLNTNSFLRLLGGINKGRPDQEDLRHAEEFAEGLKSKQ
jgi:flavodoxin